jgi:hypothetical protein
MNRVVRRAVDVRKPHRNAVVDIDRPQTNDGERNEVSHVMHGEQEDEQVIRAPL